MELNEEKFQRIHFGLDDTRTQLYILLSSDLFKPFDNIKGLDVNIDSNHRLNVYISKKVGAALKICL